MRKIEAPNTQVIIAAKRIGVGEKRDAKWWFTSGELAEATAAWRAEQADRVAQRAAHKKAVAEKSAAWRALPPPPEKPYDVGSFPAPPTKRYKPPGGRKAALGRIYDHDFIEDLDLFKAVQFARSMMRKGTPPGIANHRAARYYDVATSDVAHHTGQVASRVKGRR